MTQTDDVAQVPLASGGCLEEDPPRLPLLILLNSLKWRHGIQDVFEVSGVFLAQVWGLLLLGQM